jgi:hypothetical protein
MIRVHLFAITLFFYSCGKDVKIPYNKYTGVESLCAGYDSSGNFIPCKTEISLSPEDPEEKWFYQDQLKFKGDSATLFQSPITIKNGDTAYSASDGGFLFFKGKVESKDSFVHIVLTEVWTDYLGDIKIRNPGGNYKRVYRKRILDGRLTEEGLLLGPTLFKPTPNAFFLGDQPPR